MADDELRWLLRQVLPPVEDGNHLDQLQPIWIDGRPANKAAREELAGDLYALQDIAYDLVEASAVESLHRILKLRCKHCAEAIVRTLREVEWVHSKEHKE